MKRIIIIFGTRPEAIKMAPLVKEFQKNKAFDVKVCITAQHREMLDQVLTFFEIIPDYDLDLMKPNQNLHELTARIILNLREVFEDFKPDYTFVHGDTSTTMAASIAAFYSGSKVCHVEAGLRTYNMRSPFPEEMNRRVVGSVADYHFSPTQQAQENLLKEHIPEEQIVVTGNTVIDALLFSLNKIKEGYSDSEINNIKSKVDVTKKVILVTGHRRENHGQGFLNICKALKNIAQKNAEVQIIYPVHLNPNVQKPVYEHLGDVENITLISPLSYPAFLWLMEKSHIIITDSGGIQEEAPSLGIPVLVMRDTTERPEAVKAGTVILVGTDSKKIEENIDELLHNNETYDRMSALHNPYGDGKACSRIVNYIKELM